MTESTIHLEPNDRAFKVGDLINFRYEGLKTFSTHFHTELGIVRVDKVISSEEIVATTATEEEIENCDLFNYHRKPPAIESIMLPGPKRCIVISKIEG